ncbi:S8 family serine peptidase [Paraburkholderia bannensis]|uniref:S8 family serine peptidase n=1 Tax=Paraburkholderia bannensis TaxID=765414 RepID=UPI002AC31AA3|nr:S8 family serine peptidase [Paraburkholderia bannensis]
MLNAHRMCRLLRDTSAVAMACLAIALPCRAQTMPAGWPSTATIPYNLGGSINGTYTDRNGKTWDGTGYVVVDIDGAFRPDNPVFTNAAGKSKVPVEACIGQKTGTAWTSLCNIQSWVSRPLQGDPSAGYWFSSMAGRSAPSDSPDATCRETANPDNPQYCHYYHGTATAGIMVGEPTARWEGSTKFTYAGVAPGAQVIMIKIGGGSGTDGPRGWPINSVVDALNFVNSTLLSRTDIGSKIVAVNISANGTSVAGDLPCATDSDGARIDQVAGLLRAKGVAVVMAAGNDAVNGTGTWTCGNNVIPVGATSILSRTTPASYTNISQRINLFAPVGTADRTDGDFVLAPWAGAGSFYIWGTSFSSPQVAAAFAVLRQKFGSAPSVASLVKLLQTSGTRLTGSRAGLAGLDASVIDIKAALDGTPN